VEAYIDITSVWDRHIESLRCHHSFDNPTFPEGNTLIRTKTGRSMVLGASLPHAKDRVLHAEGYRIIWGDAKEVSSLRVALPEQFYFRASSWLMTM